MKFDRDSAGIWYLNCSKNNFLSAISLKRFTLISELKAERLITSNFKLKSPSH